MKTIPLGSVLTAALALVAVSLFSAPAAPTSPAQSPGTHETARVKVLKVFSADDGSGAIFRAYMVEWNGQEVIVEDTLAKTHYRTDDVISVLVMHQPYPQGKEPYGLLHFAVIPERSRK